MPRPRFRNFEMPRSRYRNSEMPRSRFRNFEMPKAPVPQFRNPRGPDSEIAKCRIRNPGAGGRTVSSAQSPPSPESEIPEIALHVRVPGAIQLNCVCFALRPFHRNSKPPTSISKSVSRVANPGNACFTSVAAHFASCGLSSEPNSAISKRHSEFNWMTRLTTLCAASSRSLGILCVPPVSCSH